MENKPPKKTILQLRVELARYIKANWKCIDNENNPPHLFYWRGVYECPKRKIKVRIFFQYWVRGRKRMTPCYVNMDYVLNYTVSKLTKQDVLNLLDDKRNNKANES